MISSCLKVQLNDLPPKILYFLNFNFSDFSLLYPNIGEDDFRVLSHLSVFFPPSSNLFMALPFLQDSEINPAKNWIGTMLEGTDPIGESDKPISIVCFNGENQKEFAIDFLKNIFF